MKPEPKTLPFAWQDKRILRRIRDVCEDHASALGVYVALTVAASDTGQEEFQTTQKWLASLSGFSERTVRSRIAELRTGGLISVFIPKLRAPATYRLLPFSCNSPMNGNGCRALGNGSTPALPGSEERKKEIIGTGKGNLVSER